MELALNKPAVPAPAAPVDQAKQLRILANALEVDDILRTASRLVNELSAIAYRSDASTRNLLTNKPTSIVLKPQDAARAEVLLRQLAELSERYTERMRKPADHVHKNQPPRFALEAAALQRKDPKAAAAQIAKFEACRAKFVKEGSKPVDFLSFIPGTAAVIQAALKAGAALKHKEMVDGDVAAALRRRAAGDIDGAARVVKHEADVGGTVGVSEANNLNVTIAAGARLGVSASGFAVAAQKDVADDQKVRRYATPFDSLRTMSPGAL